MADVTLRLNRAAIGRILKGSPGPVQLHIANLGREAEGKVRRCLPEVSGDLKRGVDSRMVKTAGGEWTAEIFNDLPYASWIETGRRFDPRSGKIIKVKVGPRPCMRQALRELGLSRSRRII